MKTFIATLCCCALFATAAFAQDESETSNKYAMNQTSQTADQKSDVKTRYMGSNKIIGAYIYGPNDETVGDVNSIVLDKDGKIAHAIVGLGGVAGVGETEIAVPWSAFDCKCEVKDGEKCCRATLPMTAEQLKKAPVLEREEYAELYDESWLNTNAKFYGAEAVTSAPALGSMMCVTDISGLELTGRKSMDTASSDATQQTYTSSKADTEDDGEDLGTIEEVVFDVAEHKACYVVVGDDSGVLSERHVAVPFSKINFTKKDGECCAKIAATANDLKTAPEVTPGEYKELDMESVRKQVDDGFASR